MKKLFPLFSFAIVLMVSCAKQDQLLENDLSDEPMELANGRQCAANEVLTEQIKANPARGKFLDDLEEKTKKFRGSQYANRANITLYVPVVVHVVKTNPTQITDAQIASQIAVLNQDYNKTNTELSSGSVYLAGYSVANVANCKIEFVLKQVIRKVTTVTAFGANDAMKKNTQGGSSPVNETTWLNMWVCDLSSGLLGYAQFPGGASATDGVVIDYQGFGTAAATTGYSLYSAFNKGRTATHEVGHWFNLRHIWGDARCGNDFVSDTPQHDGSNGGCPAVGTRSKCPGKPQEQWMNYMDYTNDACMYMFSSGQKTRMDAAIDAARASWINTTMP